MLSWAQRQQRLQRVTTASIDGDVQLADGEYTVTVQQPEGGEVTVYNEKASSPHRNC